MDANSKCFSPQPGIEKYVGFIKKKKIRGKLENL